MCDEIIMDATNSRDEFTITASSTSPGKSIDDVLNNDGAPSTSWQPAENQPAQITVKFTSPNPVTVMAVTLQVDNTAEVIIEIGGFSKTQVNGCLLFILT